jgi:Ca-activated chloride channel family protein
MFSLAVACGSAPAAGPRAAIATPAPPAFVPCPGAPSGDTATKTGTIRGVVCDGDTGEVAVGATVVATSPAIVGEQVVITDEAGYFAITDLPAGNYTLTFYYNNGTSSRGGVAVATGQATTITQRVAADRSRGEVVLIKGSAPVVDRRQPGEAYARIDDNPFQRVEARPLSTFSIDVDTASYSNTRRFLREGTRPPKDAVRIEELVNYFRYAYPVPQGDAPIAMVTEVGPSPWNPTYKLVRVGMQTKPIAAANVPPRNLTFLLDVSGSMEEPNKLPLLQQAMGLLVDNLRPQDSIAMVVYAGASGIALPPTRGSDKATIRAALASLRSGGSTNGEAGIKLAYSLAQRHFIGGGINRVILCTDGDFNVGAASEGDLTRMIEHQRTKGVFLTVLGFGMGNLKDATLEKLADRGNGNYGYIDSIEEARKLLVKEAGATLVTVAKDVKLQIEFNPARVAGYRLIGYENRMLADQDFADDKKDAGELGAGHSVTALYELVPAGLPVPAAATAKLKYQTPGAPTAATTSTELMTIRVRYKAPNGLASKLFSQVVTDRDVPLAATSIDFRWASAVAGFGMLLRESPERGGLTWAMVTALASTAIGTDVEGYRKEMLALVTTAAKLP